MQHIELVVTIDHKTGEYWNGRFKIVSRHRDRPAARRKAAKLRRNGFLARVRRRGVGYMVAIRRPRKIAPATHHLSV